MICFCPLDLANRRQPRECSEFFAERCETAGPATGCVVYYGPNGGIDGVFRFKDPGLKTLLSRGIWVSKYCRGEGVATRMIEHAMTRLNKTRFVGYSVTPEGTGLLKSLKSSFKVVDRNPDA